jgi:hypothetical protein
MGTRLAAGVDARALGGRTRRGARWVVKLGLPLTGRYRLDRRVLPSVLVIGAQRSGTTSLHRALAAHPRMLSPRRDKGVHYFDTVDYTRGLGWYRAHFPIADGDRMAVESSPYYLFHPAVPARVEADLPLAKLIVLLRDPVERAISHHRHEVERGFETLGLAEAIDREAERLAGAEELLRRDAFAEHYEHLHHGYLARGRYAEQLRRWYEHVPREQVCVIDANLLFADPAPQLAKVADFLGLDAAQLSMGHVNGYPPADEHIEVVAKLRAYFKPHDEELEDLLGWVPSWR